MSGAFCIVSLYWFPYFDETYTQIPIYLDKKGRGTVKFKLSDFWWSYYLQPGSEINITAYLALPNDPSKMSWGGLGTLKIITK